MENGKKFAIGISVYFVAKQLLNTIIGGLDLPMLLLHIAFAVVLILGIKYSNYVVAGIAALVALYYLPGNISGLPGSWLYLLEGILDVGAAAILIFQKDVQMFFKKQA